MNANTFRHRARLWCAIAMALLSCLPVLVAHYPQMSDYPAHLARYHVMLEGGRNPDLARYYGFTWAWTGNLGVDMLIRPFAAVFGLEAGGRIIVALIAVLTGLGIVLVDVVLRGRVTIASFLAFTMIWGPMFLTGLINFALGQAVMLWAFAAWVLLEGWRWRWAVFLPVGLLVWLCHLSAWGALGVMVLGYEVHCRNGGWRHMGPALVACWPLALPLIPLLFGHWLLGAGTSGDFSYGPTVWAFKRWIWLAAMRDTAYQLDRRSLDLVWLVLGLAAVTRRIDGRLGWGAGERAGCRLALPGLHLLRVLGHPDFERAVALGRAHQVLDELHGRARRRGAPRWTQEAGPGRGREAGSAFGNKQKNMFWVRAFSASGADDASRESV